MNILFYIPNLSQTSGGIRQYSVGLLKILGQLQEHTFYVLHNTEDQEIIGVVNSSKNLFLIPKNVGEEKSFESKKYVMTRGIQFLREKGQNKDFRVRSYLDRICRKYKIDIVHSPTQDQPFPSATKNIFTLHDVQELHFPEYFSPDDREYRARTWLYNIRHADKIVVSYQHVKDDILKYFSADDDLTEVILLNMENLWFSNFKVDDRIDTKHLHGFDDFIFYAANTWQHKNHERLLLSLAQIKEEKNIVVNLVCVGHQNEHYETLKDRVNDLQLTNQVKFLGIVEEQILYSIYQQCTAVVIPTTYEAGSFPLMESIFMKIPVICSNVTSLPETIGKSEFTFDPFNVREMSDLIVKIWSDESFRQANIDHTQTMKDRLIHTKANQKLQHLYNSI